MAYTPTVWEDEIPASSPVKFTLKDSGGSILYDDVTIELKTSVTPGTQLNAANMNKIEGGIEDAQDTADTAVTNAAAAQSTANSALSTANAAIPKSVVTAIGDLIRASGSGAVTRVPIGSNEQILKVVSGLPSWQNLALKLGKANRSTNQSVTTGTNTLVQFTTEEFDTGSFFDLPTANTKCTVPDTGYYLVIGNITFDDYNGTKIIKFKKNGSFLSEENQIYPSGGRGMPTIALVYCTAGQYIEMNAFHQAGFSINITYASLAIVKVG